MTGEKITPLIIGKSAKPHCFKNIKINSLPIQYHNNKKAWMASSIFDDWIRSFDKQMKLQKRNVLLFVDNAPSHPRATLTNVKLAFLPANTTSMCQPMKLKFYAKQLEYTIKQLAMDTTTAGPKMLQTAGCYILGSSSQRFTG